ncbi:hypothetical protein [Streptomyces sp. NPDC021562]|uniref:hypothetical protein n=1 Tax=Streptomyces sp. NPDC021562 TaxID=3155121 RepID=UPI0033F27908
MRNTGDNWGTVLDIVVDEYGSPTLRRLTHLRAHVDALIGLFVTGGFRRYPGDRSRPEHLSHRLLHDLFRELRLPPRTERLLVYWAGHGVELQRSGLRLLCSDTAVGPQQVNPGDSIDPGYLGSQLAMCGARDIVLVMDACSAGGGAQAAIDAFRREVADQSLIHDPTLTVISAAASGQEAHEHALSEAFRAVLDDPDERVIYREWGPHDQYISVECVIRALKRQLGSSQRLDPVIFGVARNDFFPNPRFDATLPDAGLERRRGRPALLRADVREHFMLKFRGIDTTGDDGYFFHGRVAALRSIVGWLRTEGSGMFVVTGAPGSGKSALLGRLAVLSDPSYREEVDRADPRIVRAAAPGTVPDIGAIDVGVHARGKHVLDCVAELADALGLPAPRRGWKGPEQFVSAVSRTGRRLTVLVDALDEALPDAVDVIAERLLRPLADLPGTKVLVGTRRRAIEAGGSTARDLIALLAPEPGRLQDLDDAAGTTDDIEAYAHQRLIDLEDSPYALADKRIIEQAARRVARESESVFLMARLFTRALAGRSDTLALDGPEAREIFRSRDVAEVFAADLERYGILRQKATDLLAPLAWALGSGLPRRTVWANAATALTGGARTYTEEDVTWVLAHAGAHLIEAGEAAQSVYRLYHQAYADYLRQTVAEPDRAPVLLYEAVLSTVPGADGHRNWARAGRYALKHLPAYALAADRLPHLLRDARFLAYADPTQMMHALNTPEQQRRSVSRLYLRVWDELRELTPEDRAAVLQLRAGVDEPDALPELATDALLGWRTRWGNGRRTNFHGVLVGGPASAVGAVAIDLAPSGTLTVAACDVEGSVRVWDGASGELLHTLSAGPAPVVAVEFARAHGRLLLAAASDRQVSLWDALSGRRAGAICSHPRKVRAMAFGATLVGEPLLVTSAGDRRTRLWDIERGAALRTWPVDGLRTHALALTSLPGIGDVLVAAHAMDRVSAWKIERTAGNGVPRRLWRRTGLLWARHGFALGKIDGRAVVVGRGGVLPETVRCLDLRTGEPVGEEGETKDGTSTLGEIGFLPECLAGVKGDPAAFVTGGPDGQVRLSRGGGTVGGWTGHSATVGAVAGVRNGSGDILVVSGSQDGTVRLWNTGVSTSEDHHEHGESHEDAVTSSDLVTQPDGRLLLATGTTDGTVWIWDGRTGRRIARCSKVEAKMRPNDYMAAADGLYRSRLSSGHTVRVTAVSWIPAADGHDATLVSADEYGDLQFWSTEGDPLVRRETGRPVSALTTTAVGGDGLLAVGHPHTIALYGSYGERPDSWLASLFQRRRIGAVAFAPQADGTLWLTSGDRSGRISLWEHPSGRVVGQLAPGEGGRAHQGPVRGLVAALGREGPVLVSADDDAVCVWDLTSRSLVAEFDCKPVHAPAATTTADGRVLVAAPTADRAVEIFDARAGTRLGAVRGFPQPVSTVSMLRDRHDSDAVLLAVGHGRVVHLVELLESSDRRRKKDTS